jgi:hypothetical protein
MRPNARFRRFRGFLQLAFVSTLGSIAHDWTSLCLGCAGLSCVARGRNSRHSASVHGNRVAHGAGPHVCVPAWMLTSRYTFMHIVLACVVSMSHTDPKGCADQKDAAADRKRQAALQAERKKVGQSLGHAEWFDSRAPASLAVRRGAPVRTGQTTMTDVPAPTLLLLVLAALDTGVRSQNGQPT